jgi:hypothetical protein
VERGKQGVRLINKPLKALAYVEFLDLLFYPAFKRAGLGSRFEFTNDDEWPIELLSRARDMEDKELSNYLKKFLETDDKAWAQLVDYTLSRLEQALK